MVSTTVGKLCWDHFGPVTHLLTAPPQQLQRIPAAAPLHLVCYFESFISTPCRQLHLVYQRSSQIVAVMRLVVNSASI